MIKNYELLDVVKVPELFCNHSYISQVHHTYISTSVEGKEGGGVCLLFCPDCYLAKFLSINGYYSCSEFRVPNIVKRKQE